MKTKDLLLIAFVPLALLLIPLVGSLTIDGWNWTASDFVLAWVIFAATTFAYRLLATRKGANTAYRAGAALAIAGGFLITWTNLAVQIIGDDNPGNLLYFVVILAGLIGVGVARFQAASLAKLALGMSLAILAIPLLARLLWPADFDPGFARVFILNSFFAALFAGSGLLFRHAASRPLQA